MNTTPIKKREMFVFAWGDVFGGGAQALISVLYLIYLVDFIGIDAGLAGAAILISKVWDAVSDPLMGVISDNTRTRFGRRRPYILFGGLLLIASFALLWYPTASWGDLPKVIYAIATYLIYSTVSTIIAVPYSSLSAEITMDIKKRNSVNVLRLVVSTAATAICTLLPSMVLEMYKAGSITLTQFYLIVGFGFGVFFALPLVLIGLITKERVALPVEKSVFEFKTFVEPLKNKTFRGLVKMYLAQSIAMDILGSGIVFYAIYVAKGSSTVFLGTFIGVQLLMFPIIQVLINKIDKKKIYYTLLPLALVSFAGVGMYPSDWPIVGAYALTALTAVGFAGAQLMSWIIFPDTIDVAELKNGTRTTGSYSGIMTFIRKTSSAIAIQIFALMLAFSGYVKATEAIPVPDQPDSALIGIRIAMAGSFVILMTLGYFAGKHFPLTNQLSIRVRHFLKRKEESIIQNWSVEEQAEYQEIATRLF
ncbi:MAG: MFS transporter [Candidatus Izemoplasmatales bacterium]|nr:MFS transporter [bacterium]MDZ4197616.1 MFS transporter [Candidatus Izemoplasmatales bacterium]